jgi:hypothetical protein
MGAGVHHQGAKSRRRAHRHRLRMRRMMLAKSQEKLGDALGVTFQQVQKMRVPTESARAGCNRSPTSCRPQWRSSLRGSAPDRFVEARFLKQIGHSWRRPLPQNWMSGLPDQRGLALRATD